MQKKIIFAATVLLLVQLMLVAATRFGSKVDMNTAPAAPFLAIKVADVSSVKISGADGKSITLEKNNDSWIIPDAFRVAADRRQVDALLDKLAQLKQGFVVASSKEAARRFQVTEDNFERHLVVKEKDRISGDFYIGTSPAFRQVHARKVDSDDIVAVNLATYELETTADKWLDKTVLQIDDKDLSHIEYPDFSLSRKKEEGKEESTAWQLEGVDTGNVDTTATRDLADAISRLTITSVIDPKASGDIAIEQPELRFSINTAKKATLHYTFAQVDNESFAVKRSDMELLFKVDTATVETLKSFNRAKILQQQAEPPIAATQTSEEEPGPTEPPAAEKPAAPGD